MLILIPAAIAALNALNIDAISDPAISMLNQILNFIPLLLAAGVVLTVFYFIGHFVSELVTNLLASAGFDSVLDILGLPDISPAPSRALRLHRRRLISLRTMAARLSSQAQR